MTRTTTRVPAAARPGPEAGFTLVEALVAMLVLAVGMISVANLMLVAATSNSVGNQSTAAATIATQELERLTAIPYDQLLVGGDLSANDPNFFSETNVPGVGLVRTRWRVTAFQNQTRLISVRSEGTGALSGARSRAEFTTIRSCTNVPMGCPPPP
jgi:type IV pilus assembly protein PilV